MAKTETVDEFLARGGTITKLPYIPPDRTDPDFSYVWQTKPRKTDEERELEEYGFQVVTAP